MNSKIMKERNWTTGKIIISFLGLFTAVSPYVADWNVTHIYNPLWTPHAKFHNAQTMALGAFLGTLTLYCLWFRKFISAKQRLIEPTVIVHYIGLHKFLRTFFQARCFRTRVLTMLNFLLYWV